MKELLEVRMKHILVVEDDTHLIQALHLLLEFSDFKVSRATNATEALEVLRSGPVDLVLTDIGLPGRDGLQLIQDIRAEFPSLKFIAMSGILHHSGICLTVAEQLGAQHTLRKPFTQESLLEAIESSLQNDRERSAS